MVAVDVLAHRLSDELADARAAHARADWAASYAAFVRADGIGSMSLPDLDAYAMAAWRLGHGREAVRLAERLYNQLLRTDPAAAAMKAVEIALEWVTRGDLFIAAGWTSRARRLLADAPEGAVHGYLAYLDAVLAVIGQDTEGAAGHADRAAAISARSGDPSLAALVPVAQAVVAFADARASDGRALIDEALLHLLAGDVAVDWAGDIYCVVLNQCHRLGDLPRMRTWTDALERWCDVFKPVTYYRVCDVHRLQLSATHTDYRLLEDELVTASAALEGVNGWVGAEGFYQLGEVRRLRGDSEGAFAAFAKARALGVEPQPGAALLTCRLGDPRSAATDLRIAMAGLDRVGRMRMLRAAVEIALACDAVDDADIHCRELEEGAAVYATPGFRAWAAHARGAVEVQRGAFAEALVTLESALAHYRVQKSRYESAEVYEWMALAHTGLGDDTAAAADVATAEAIYEQLAVQPSGTCARRTPGGLTRRELEVLRAVAGGATNRQVAQQISISENTVGRHLANVYTKLGVSSRTAAVTWAHQHNLIASAD